MSELNLEGNMNILIAGLKNQDPRVRRRSVSRLEEMAPDCKEAIPALIDALQDDHFRVREGAAWTLGLLGPAAKEAVPAAH